MDPRASAFVPINSTPRRQATGPTDGNNTMENRGQLALTRTPASFYQTSLRPTQIIPGIARSLSHSHSQSSDGGVRLGSPSTHTSDGDVSMGQATGNEVTSLIIPTGPRRGVAPAPNFYGGGGYSGYGGHGPSHTNPIPSVAGNTTSPRAHPDKPSVKHLTCYYWHKLGKCRFSDDECLYAHFNTGQLAEAPQKVEPGGMSSVYGAEMRSC